MLPYTDKLLPVEMFPAPPVEMFPVTSSVEEIVVAPVTAKVDERVVAPVTPRVEPIVANPVTARLEESVVAAATPKVPAIWVLPLAEATVSLLVATLKSPTMFAAVVESWSEESVPPPSLTLLRVPLRLALSEVLSRPV
tara:strand:+ start:113 stop:529 length:417 start_codon:yes stop_codon:yes gene_type:complete